MELYVGLHSFTIIYQIYFYVLSYRQNPKLHNKVGTRKTIGHDSHSLPALTSSPSAVLAFPLLSLLQVTLNTQHPCQQFQGMITTVSFPP